MKIALVHSFYTSKIPSGENQAVLDQYELLLRAGFDVELFASRTDVEAKEWSYAIRSAVRMSTGMGRDPSRDVDRFSPDIIHIHNLTPNYSSNWLQRASAPVVATLHNFRAVCANGLMFRDGKSCDECVQHGSSRAILHACYRGSRLQTIPIAIGTRGGASKAPLVRHAKALVALSEAANDRFVSLGLPQSKIHVIPNGARAGAWNAGDQTNRKDWLFVGRLTNEKGLRELLEIWPPEERLTVVGEGPQREMLQSTTGPNVVWEGAISREKVRLLMLQHEGLVFPSRCFEMQPTVISEALAAGLPVLCFAGTSPAENLERLGVGFRYQDQASLELSMSALRFLGDRVNDACEKVFRERFSEASWLRAITDLYTATSRT